MEDEFYGRIALNKDGKFPMVIQSTVDVFLSAISVRGYYSFLMQAIAGDALKDLGSKFLAASSDEALWCILLLQFDPPGDVAVVIMHVIEAFSTSVVVPTGLRLKSAKYGNSHLAKDKLVETRDVSKIAMRIIVLSVGTWLQENNMNCDATLRETRQVFMDLLKAQVSKCDDPMTVVSAAKAIANGIPVDIFAPGPSQLREQNLQFSEYFISTLHVVLADNLQLFFAKKKQVQNQEAELSHAQETYSDAMFDYKGVLYEVTSKDDEEDLRVPLSNYLKDSESLKAAYTKRNKAAEEVEASKIALAEHMSFISILAPCCRLIFTLCSIVMHALVFERSQQDERSSEEERAARDFLCSFDWNKVLSFGIFERSVNSSLMSRLYMSCAARCFSELQDIFCHDGMLVNEYDSDEEGTLVPCPVHLAMKDLSSDTLCWYSQNKPSSTFEFAVNLPSLDTRISVALCYWGGMYNLQSQNNMKSWRQDEHDDEHFWLKIVQKAHSLGQAIAVSTTPNAYINEKDAGIVRYMKSLVFPSNYEELFESSKPVFDIQAASHFAEYNATIMADAFLTFSTLEGNCLVQRRGVHPLEVSHLLYRQSHCNLDESQVGLLISNLTKIITGEYHKAAALAAGASAVGADELILTSALYFLNTVIQGRFPSFVQPSEAPAYEHLLFESESRSMRRIAQSYLNDQQILFLAQISAQTIYCGQFVSVLPVGPHNHCPFGISLSTLTALTLINSDVVWEALKSASSESTYSWSIAEKTSKKENEDPDDKLLIPLLLAFEGGSLQVFTYLAENMKKKMALDHLLATTKLGKVGVMKDATTFLAASTSKVATLHTKIIMRNNFISGIISKSLIQFASIPHTGKTVMMPILNASQYPGVVSNQFEIFDLAQQMLLLAATLIASGRPSAGAGVPYSSAHNVFLREFGVDGNGILVASEMFVFASNRMLELSKNSIIDTSQDQNSNTRTKTKTKTQWELFNERFYFRSLRNILLFTLENLIEICTRRPEIQSYLAEHCKPLVQCLPQHLFPPHEATSYHVGIAELCCRFLSAMCLRHDVCQELVLSCGCSQGMMASLAECLPSKGLAGAQRLSASIVSAIQQLVVRNKSAWVYVQMCSGIDGLLQLCQLGNTTIKNLCCSTLMEEVSDWDKKSYGDDVTIKGGIEILYPLLSEKEDETTTISALRLIYTLSVNSPIFRKKSFSASGTALFASILAVLRRSRDDSIRILVCRILSTFGAENPSLLRRVLQGEKESLSLLVRLSSETESPSLTAAAITSLACMTVSDDADFPTGAPFLRQSLSTGGYLPSLR